MLPNQVAKIIALRELGHTTASIATLVGRSERTVKRVCKEHSVSKGSLLENARREVGRSLIDDICNDSQVKGLLTALVNQVLVHSTMAQGRLQKAASGAWEATTLDAYLKLARAESASALATKSNVDTIRSLLRFGQDIGTSDELPVLTVRCLTEKEVEAIRAEQEQEALALDLPGEDSGEDEVVVERPEGG